MRWLSTTLLIAVCCAVGCAKNEESKQAAEPAAAAPKVQPTPAAPIESSPSTQAAPSSNEPANPILAQKLLTAEEVAAGWISLFDGTTLFGWKSTDDDINWSVKDGTITADSGSNGALLTTVPFADFELICEYRLAPDANSGVFLRSTATPKNFSEDFYEVNITDVQPQGYLTGSLVGRKKADVDLKGSGDWQTLRMIAQGTKFQIFHDGKQILDFNDEATTARFNGFIGLQKNSGKVEFRKVNLKPIGMESLFNGKDLTDWRVVPGSKSEFSVVDGTIKVVNGAGFLETNRTFEDFIFQTQVKTNAKDLNSGFFFRAMEGSEKNPSNGYEVQVHNGIKNGDRNKPDNAGTGAIFRRVEARRVVSNDLEWCTLTLVTEGPRIAVWVDGYQVVDWEDTRAPDENPRKGRRVEGGHISLQGHDPTTDVQFRQLMVHENAP